MVAKHECTCTEQALVMRTIYSISRKSFINPSGPCYNMRIVFPGIGIPMINTLRPRQDGRYFADDVLKCIFLNENVWISLNIPALVQIMDWRRPGDKPLSEPMLVIVPTHICVTWPQWVNIKQWGDHLIFMMEIPILIKWHKRFNTKLEQLERLRSEDTPRRPVITLTIDQFILNPKSILLISSYRIPSQKKVKAEKIRKICEKI